MNPWSVNPSWQNFSSLYREAISASEAKTEVERRHHLTAALYFGIAAIEAFLNQKMRKSWTQGENKLMKLLRYTTLLDKVKEWPLHLTGKSLNLNSLTSERIKDFNDIRADLTHSKTLGHDVYEKLETIDPLDVVDTIAEYIVRFHVAEGTRFPYWVFGWNYLNPGKGKYDILLFNDQQFCFSLRTLGVQIPGPYLSEETWRNKTLSTYEGYICIRDLLLSQSNCEPKFERFPHQPKLCRRWWTSHHHISCGAVVTSEN